MPDNNTRKDEPTVVKHTHYELSYAAKIVDALLMPRPPKEEGGALLDIKTLMLILGALMVFGIIIVAVASSDRSVISSINLK
jgi:hypothetical protein